MVAIIGGKSLGLNLSSLAALGARGRIGTAEQGASGERAYVNVATGDLVLQDQDTSLVGTGSLASALRTYNSQGRVAGQGTWRDSVSRSVQQVGGNLRRTDADGSTCDYVWSPDRALYVATVAAGSSLDTIVRNQDGSYTWTDGATGARETYQGAGKGLIVASTDTSGNSLTYRYDSEDRLSRIENGNGEAMKYSYVSLADGRRQVSVSNGVDGVWQYEIAYIYDALDRLQSVRVELDPQRVLPRDVTSVSIYTTSYTYEGDSDRVSTLTQTDGTSLSFTYVLVDGMYRIATVADGEQGVTSFQYEAQGRTLVTDPVGVNTAYEYDAQGRLVRICNAVTAANRDGVGHVHYSYDAAGNLAGFTDATGNKVSYGYDVRENLTSQVDSAGNTVTRTYDARNQLLSETVYRIAATGAQGASGAETTKYVYDAGGRNLLRFVVKADGHLVEHRYDAQGLRRATISYAGDLYVASRLGPLDVPTEAGLEAWVQTADLSLTERTDNAYDARGQITAVTTYGRVDAHGIGDASTALTTHYVFDEHGQLLSMFTPYAGSATLKTETSYVRDELGRVRVAVATSRLADGTIDSRRTTYTRYDDAWRQTTSWDDTGLRTSAMYDRAGRLVYLGKSGADAFAETRYFYDVAGRLVMTQEPAGTRSWTLYDDAGNKAADVDATGHVTEYVHDAAGRLTETIRYGNAIDTSALADVNGNPMAAAGDQAAARALLSNIRTAASGSGKDERSWRVYDSAGRLGWQVDAQGYVTETQYDGASRVIGTRRYANPIDTTALRDGQATPADTRLKTRVDFEGRQYADDGTPVTPYAGVTAVDVQPGAPIPTGTLTFFLVETGAPLGSAGVVAGDSSGVVASTFPKGTHVLCAVYSGDANYASSVAFAEFTAAVDVQGPPSSSDRGMAVALSASAASAKQGDPLTLNATVTGSGPDGLVTFFAGTTALGVAKVIGGAATLHVDHLDLDVGAVAIVATYAAGDVVGAVTSPSVSLDVQPGIRALRLPAASPDEDATSERIYDAAGLLVGEIDPEGYLIEYRYDAALRLVETIEYAETAAAWNEPQFAAVVSAAREAHSIELLRPAGYGGEPEGVRSYRFYNARGQVAAEVDGERYLTERVYDELGNESWRIRYAKQLDVPVASTSSISELRPHDDTGAQTTTRIWDGFGRLRTERNAEGTLTEYEYDAAGNLTSTTIARGTADQRTLRARYDALGRITAQLSGVGAAKLDGNQTTAEVEAIWRTYWTRFTYDAAGRKTSSTGPDGSRTVFFYDDAGRLRFTVNGAGEVQESTYDALGHVATTVQFAAAIARADLTSLRGGLLSATENALAVQLLERARVAPDVYGQLGRNSITSYGYDSRGQLVQTTDAEGGVIGSEYDAFGRVKRTREALGDGRTVVTRYWRDRLGRANGVTEYVNGVAYPSCRFWATKYDAWGRATEVQDPNGNITSMAYDHLGRLVYVHDPMSDERATTYDAFGRVLVQYDAFWRGTAYAYDDAARSVTVTTPESVRVTTTHNREGQTETVIHWEATNGSVADGQRETTRYTYDEDGHLTSTRTALTVTASSYDESGRVHETTDANGNTVRYAYDAASRVLSRTVDPDGLALTTSYRYDGKGQRYEATDANGVVTRYTFDRKGEVLTQTVDPDGLALTTVYAYDPQGNVLSVQSPGGSRTEYRYDEENRRTETTVIVGQERITERFGYDLNGNLAWRLDANGNHTTFAYDAANRLVYTVDGAGNVTKNDYDRNGRVIAVTVFHEPLTGYTRFGGPGGDGTGEALGRSPDPGMSWGQPYLAVSVAEVDARVVRTPGADTVEHRIYDADGRLACTVDGTGSVVRYTYDANGNVVERIAYANRFAIPDGWDWTSGTVPQVAADPVHDVRIRTAYDLLNRPIATIDGTGAVTVQLFDGNGNVVARFAPAQVVTLPDPEPTTAAGFAAALVSAARGAFDPSRDSCVRNGYDAANRLEWTVDGTGAVTHLVYDADRLVKRVAYATPVDPASEAFPLLQLVPADGAGTAALVAAARRAPQTVASSQDRVTLFAYDDAGRRTFQIDAAGAVTREVLDRNGNVVLRYAYGVRLAAPMASSAVLRESDVKSLLRGAFVAANPGDAGKSSTEIDLHLRDGARIEAFVYDAANRVEYSVDAEGAVTWNGYDGIGHVVATTRTAQRVDAGLALGDPDAIQDVGGALRTAIQESVRLTPLNQFDPPNRTTLYAYDSGNRLAFTVNVTQVKIGTDATGCPVLARGAYVERLAYDGAGRLTDRTLYKAPVVPGRLAFERRMSSSALDRATSAIASSGTESTHYDHDAAGHVTTVTDGCGYTETYGYNALGQKESYRDRNGAVWTYAYDAAGRLVLETSPAVTRTVVSIRSDGVPWPSERAAAERIVTRTRYDALGNISARIEAEGTEVERVTQYAYDAVGRRVETTHPRVKVAGAGDVELTSRVHYDAFGDAVETVDTAGVSSYAAYDRRGRVMYEVDREGFVTGYARNAFGDVEVQTRYAARPDLALQGNVPTVAQLEAAVSASALDHVGDRVRRVTYDQLGRAVLVQDLDGSSAGLTVRNAYDAFGNLVERATLVDPATANAPARWSAVTHYYDQRGLERATIDPLGSLTTLERDAAGRVIARTSYGAPASAWTREGYDSVARGAQDRVETFSYDRDGRLTNADDANGISEVYGYDANGNKTSYTNKRGFRWTYAYDALGRLTAETMPAVVLTSATIDAQGRITPAVTQEAVITRLGYDAFGNVTTRTEAAGRPEERTTRYVYDAWDRQVTTVLPTIMVYAGESIAQLTANGTRWNAPRVEVSRAPTTTVEYDAAGNAVSCTDALGNKSYKAYDREGRVAFEIDADGYVTRHDRNGFGEETALTRFAVPAYSAWRPSSAPPATAVIDAVMARCASGQDRTLTTEYDDLGRVKRVIQPRAWAGDALAGTVEYGYDAMGLVAYSRSRIDADRWAVSTFIHDLKGQETVAIDAMGYVTTQRFDAFGQVTSRTEFATAIAGYETDTATRETSAAFTHYDASPLARSADDRTVEYAYDRLGRKVTETRIDVEYTDLTGIENDLRSAGSNAEWSLEQRFTDLAYVTLNPGSDARSLVLRRRARGNLTTTYGYDALGNQTRVTDALGNSTYTYYDGLGRVTAVTAPTRGSTVNGTQLTPLTTFERDALGNVVRKTEFALGTDRTPVPPSESRVAVDGLGNHLSSTPAFDDSAGRAAPAGAPDPSGNNRVTLAMFDARGSATQVQDAGGVNQYFSYDAGGRMTKQWLSVYAYNAASVGVLLGSSVYTVFEYDKRGNQTRIVTPGSSTGYDANSGVKLLSLAERLPVITSMKYNAFGELTERATFASNEAEPARSSKEWFEYDNAGRMWRTNGGDGVVRVKLYDLLGRATADIMSAGSCGSSLDDGRSLAVSNLTALADVLALPQGTLRRTDFELDRLGRALKQTLPARANTVHYSFINYSSTPNPDPAAIVPDAASFRPVIRQTFDRWGNVTSLSDAASEDHGGSWRTNYRYDKNNHLIYQQQPEAEGSRPETSVFYDQLGRQVAVRDAMGHVNVQLWDGAGQLEKEIHADVGIDDDSGRFVGVVTRAYDAFGDQVHLSDAMGNGTSYGYDKRGRNTTISSDPVTVAQAVWVSRTTAPDGQILDGRVDGVTTTTEVITTRKRYDELGRVIEAVDGAGAVTAYAYDLRGNIVATRKPMGQVTLAAFDLEGRQRGQVNPAFNGVSDFETWDYGAFGKLQAHRDLGGGQHTYHYDLAGQLTSQTDHRGSVVIASQDVSYSYDAAGQMVGISSVETRRNIFGVGTTATKTTTYFYDAAGRHAIEQVYDGAGASDGDANTTAWPANHYMTYDALGRLRTVREKLASGSTLISLWNRYDAVGNVAQQTIQWGGGAAKEYYSHYDAMNRQTHVQCASGYAITPDQGHILRYDRNGNRTEDITWGTQLVLQGTPPLAFYKSVSGRVAHYYEYDRLNRLTSVSVGGLNEWYTPVSGRTKIDNRQYDRASRTVLVGPGPSNLPPSYLAALTLGAEADGARNRVTAYDDNGRILAQRTRLASGVIESDAIYLPGSTAPADACYDSNGNLLKYKTLYYSSGELSLRTGIGLETTAYTITMDKAEGYLERDVTAVWSRNPGQPGHTRKTYDANGALVKFEDLTKPSLNKDFVNDASGHILVKRSLDARGNKQSLLELVVNGKTTAVWGEGSVLYTDVTYQPITNTYPSAAIGSFQVRGGDTLESIALSAYGDASLWYLIADANALSGNADLRVGQMLQIPTRIGGASNSASTFKPYDPTKIIGNTAPNLPLPPPPKKSKWQVFKAIAAALIQAVVTVVVSVYAGPVAGAMAGELVGQIAGNALGVRDGFDFEAMAMAGVKGAATYGVSWALSAEAAEAGVEAGEAVQAAGAADTSIADVAFKAATSNALGQGLAITVGLQKSFSWNEVALAGAGAAAGSAAGFLVGGVTDGAARAIGDESEALGRYAQGVGRVVAATASGMASTVTVTALRGGRVQWDQVAADAFGNALGNALGGAMLPAVRTRGAGFEVTSGGPRGSGYASQRTSPGELDAIDRAMQEEERLAAMPAGADTSSGGLEQIDRSMEGTSPGELEAMDSALQNSPFQVGREARRGFWGVSQAQLRKELERAPTDEEILARTKELIAANPGKEILKEGDELIFGNGTISAAAEKAFNRMNATYQEARAATELAGISGLELIPSHRVGEDVQWAAIQAKIESLKGTGAARYVDSDGNVFSTFCESCHDGSDAANRNLARARMDPAVNYAQGTARQVGGATELVTAALLAETPLAPLAPVIGTFGVANWEAGTRQKDSLVPTTTFLEEGAVDAGVHRTTAQFALFGFELAVNAAAGVALTAPVISGRGAAAESGARRVLDPTGWDAAEEAYNGIRASTSDVARISENSGMTEAQVSRIKEHVFFREHELDSGLRRFDADPEIVNAWDRLTAGDHVSSDLDLLRHEVFESRFESIFKTNYRQAHSAALRSGRTWTPE